MKRNLVVYEVGLKPISLAEFSCIVYVEPSPLDVFTKETVNLRSGKLNFVTNDISAFFNQQRLAKLGNGVLEYAQNLLRKASPVLTDIPDDVLAEAVKSRYIQSHTDVYNWTQQLQHGINDEVKRVLELTNQLKSNDDKKNNNNPDPANQDT